jgi:voltage-dependent potassium channel beta subunit
VKYRKLGRCGLKVSSVSVGAWLTAGGSVQDHAFHDILRAAIEGGINFIDLADIYARGEAERVVGRALGDYRRSELVLSSKVFWPMSDDINDCGLSRKHIIESCEKSLQRLGTDYIDLYFCHRMDPDVALDETVRAMDDLVRQGKVLYWGTSVWDATTLRESHAIAEKHHAYAPVVEQPMYNLLDRSIEAEVLPAARELGMGVVAWSPLAGGVLTGKYNDSTPRGTRATTTQWLEGWLTEDCLARVRKLSEIADDLGITTGELSLAWLLHQPGISSVITGATKSAHVTSNLRAAEVELDSDVLGTVDGIFEVAQR